MSAGTPVTERRAGRAAAAALALGLAAATLGCGGDGERARSASDTPPREDTETTRRTTTTERPATTTTTADTSGEPVLVVCEWDTLELHHIGMSSGEVVHTTPAHPNAATELGGFTFDGEQVGGPWMGLAAILCGAPPRTMFSADFSLAIGVADYYGDGTQVPVYVNLASPDLLVSSAVEPGPLQDFGPDRPETLVASFTPEGAGIFWRESQEGQCSSYLAPEAVATDQFVTRDEVAGLRIGDGGSCYGTDMQVRWVGAEPLVCTTSFPCDDANGNEVEAPAETAAPGATGPVENSVLPPSERYLTGHPLFPAAFQVNETGLTYFVGEDTTADRSVLFSWAGDGSQPEEILDLGTGQFSIVGALPTAR